MKLTWGGNAHFYAIQSVQLLLPKTTIKIILTTIAEEKIYNFLLCQKSIPEDDRYPRTVNTSRRSITGDNQHHLRGNTVSKQTPVTQQLDVILCKYEAFRSTFFSVVSLCCSAGDQQRSVNVRNMTAEVEALVVCAVILFFSTEGCWVVIGRWSFLGSAVKKEGSWAFHRLFTLFCEQTQWQFGNHLLSVLSYLCQSHTSYSAFMWSGPGLVVTRFTPQINFSLNINLKFLTSEIIFLNMYTLLNH